MVNHADLIVVGAGPAGLSAAIAARSCGLDVLVVDDQGTVGGQIFRNIQLPFVEKALDKHDKELGLKLVEEFQNCGAQFFPQTSVWGMEKNTLFCQHNGKSQKISASKILFATGGMERPVPFNGWTLPGVMTVGAAEIIIRSGGELSPNKEPVVLVGNGPLLLALATHLLELNIPIAAWLDTGRVASKMKSIVHMGHVFKDMPYFKRGMGMALEVLKKRVPVITGITEIEALGQDAVEKVRYKKGDTWHEIKTSILLRHENIIPRIQIPNALGVELVWDSVQRYWHPKTDLYGRTNINNLFITGDASFVEGGEIAMGKGFIAGITVAQDLGVISEKEAHVRMASSLQKMQNTSKARKYLRYVFAPNKDVYKVSDDVTVCRCEGVKAKAIKDAVKSGFTSPDEVKRMTRIGMGPCQGRMCGNALAEIIAQELGIEAEKVGMLRCQQPFTPVTLGAYVETALSEE